MAALLQHDRSLDLREREPSMPSTSTADDDVRPSSAAHTIDIALERVRSACDRAGRAASSAAVYADDPDPFVELASRRAAYVQSTGANRPTPARGSWRARSIRARAVLRRWVDGRESMRSAYHRQLRLIARAVVACGDALDLSLPAGARVRVENERHALLSDQRRVAELASRSPTTSTPRHAPHFPGIAGVVGLAIGAAAASARQTRSAVEERDRP